MPVAPLSSIALYYELYGAPAGPVLMLSHALGTDCRLWDKQLEALGRKFRVLRYDTRGHGRSSAPDGEYTVEDLANDALQLLDYLDIQQATFCGVSLGGITALWLAKHAPQRISSIIAANTSARIGTAEGWSARIQQVAIMGTESLVDAAVPRWFTSSFLEREPAAGEYARRVLASTSPTGYMGCCGALRDADLTDQMADIDVPVLLITGTHDPVTPPSDAVALQLAIPHSSLIELDAAHLSNLEVAGPFAENVLLWLQRKGEDH